MRVNICGDLVVPAEIDAIRLTVFNEDRSVSWWGLNELTEGVVSEPLEEDSGSEPVEAPDADLDGEMPDGGVADAETELDGAQDGDAAVMEEMEPVPAEGTAISVSMSVPKGEGRTWVQAQGLYEGIVVVTGEVRPTDTANLRLDRACLGVICPLGQTCVAPEGESSESQQRMERVIPIPPAAEGLESQLLVTIDGPIETANAYISLIHPAYEAVTLAVVDPDGTSHVIHDGPGGDSYGPDPVRRFPLTEVVGLPASGRWILTMTDHREGEDGANGQLDTWGIDFLYGVRARCELVPAEGTCP